MTAPISTVTPRRSGLIALADGVRAYFEATGIAASVTAVSRNARDRQDNVGPTTADRVSFFEVLGASGATRWGQKASQSPMSMLELARPCAVSVWGVDPNALQESEAQDEAAEALFELTLQAMRRAVDLVTGEGFYPLSNMSPGSWTKTQTQKEIFFGVEIVWQFSLKTSFFDRDDDFVAPTPVIAKTMIVP